MKCHECIEQLSAYRDHMLTQEMQKELEMHLEACPSCNEEMELLTKILDELNTMQDVEVPEIVHRSIMKRIYKDKEEAKKRNDLKTWMKYIASTAAVLLIVVVLLDGTQILNYPKSNVAKTESTTEMSLQENDAFASEPEIVQFKIAQDTDQLNNEEKQAMDRIRNSETISEAIEIWEITASEKAKVIQRIGEYSETYELQAQYLPDEVNPTTIMIYGLRDKNELFKTITEIDSDIIISKEELEGENLEIIIK